MTRYPKVRWLACYLSPDRTHALIWGVDLPCHIMTANLKFRGNRATSLCKGQGTSNNSCLSARHEATWGCTTIATLIRARYETRRVYSSVLPHWTGCLPPGKKKNHEISYRDFYYNPSTHSKFGQNRKKNKSRQRHTYIHDTSLSPGFITDTGSALCDVQAEAEERASHPDTIAVRNTISRRLRGIDHDRL